jgi:hypothetical protein
MAEKLPTIIDNMGDNTLLHALQPETKAFLFYGLLFWGLN